MDIFHLIRHPESLNQETLHHLRELVAVHPYFQVARLLYLKNLFLLHDPSFDAELRRAALYMPNRRILFEMAHGKNYSMPAETKAAPREDIAAASADRTAALLDSFLSSNPFSSSNEKRVTADPSTDYMAYLMQTKPMMAKLKSQSVSMESPRSDRTHSLINTFIGQRQEKLVLSDTVYGPELNDQDDVSDRAQAEEACFTETLARIYIKQGRYERAVEILTKINSNNRKKSIYFADQIRFLQKLIVNSKHKSKS